MPTHKSHSRTNAAPDLTFERRIPGLVAGVDEAGRGPWAGPVLAAAVILDHSNLPPGLNDSKALSPKAREAAFEAIRARALALSWAYASVAEIDQLNILRATHLAMERAVAGLAIAPAHVLVDGNSMPALPMPASAIIGGDARSLSVAAASIAAKVVRDRMMCALAIDYPSYGFERHKGYGTAAHRQVLESLGPTAHHRLSFAPVAAAAQRAQSGTERVRVNTLISKAY